MISFDGGETPLFTGKRELVTLFVTELIDVC